MATMAAPGPPRPPWLVGEVIVIIQLPGNLSGALLDRFQVTWEDGGGVLSSELYAGRGLHAFLGHLVSAVDPVPGLECLSLMGVERDRIGHLLKLFFSVPVGLYYTNRQLFAFVGDLPVEGFPLMV